jgi:hypothetical protein
MISGGPKRWMASFSALTQTSAACVFEEPALHRDAGDVGAPDLTRLFDP